MMKILLYICMFTLVSCGSAPKKTSDRQKTDGDNETVIDPDKRPGDGQDDPPGDQDPPDDTTPDQPKEGDFIFASLGDSITAGLNIDALLVEKESLVWSSGEALDNSHYSKLKSTFDVKSIYSENVAVSGSRARDLADQISNIESKEVHYATILTGANDICNWTHEYDTDLAEYAEKIGTALDTMQEKFPKVKVVLAPIPEINELYELKKDDARCRQFWSFLGCVDLLSNSATDEDRTKFKDRWRDANDALEAAAETRGSFVHYAKSIAETKFQLKDISEVDCFHPSVEGQKTLATESWDEDFAASALPD